jgi:exopolysaccharide biosynthesis polyprenyl glycosylphosphotransferase
MRVVLVAKQANPSEGEGWAALSVKDRYLTSVGGAAPRLESAVMAPFRIRLIASDAVLVVVAMAVGLFVSSRQSAWQIDPLLAIYGTPLAIGALWMGMLVLRGSYDRQLIGLGADEIRRVVSGTLYTFAIVAGVSYLVRADISRAYAYVSLPLGVMLIVGSHLIWRRWLYRERARGRFMARTIVVAESIPGDALAKRLNDEPHVGYQVAGRVGLPGGGSLGLPSWLDAIDAALLAGDASVVAIDPGDSAPHDAIRHLAWRLEGRGIDLLISPGMLDIAGPRVTVRPAAGLPLLHLDEVALSRPQRFAKRTLDIAGSTIAIVVLSPVMFACGLAVKISSPGPVIFRQPRIGLAGTTFTMMKFRSMRVNAEIERESLRAELNKEDPLFKMPQDPRVTTVGRVIRRWSLDELPQLFNVLGGSMSLVGPRPHPLDDVDRYGLEAFRRLALKPGMTGLWQVEGRSDLAWPEALRLDLNYVERWSLLGDLVLLARTVRAVVQGRGAH